MKQIHYLDIDAEISARTGARNVTVRDLLTRYDGARECRLARIEILPGGCTPKETRGWETTLYVLEGEGELELEGEPRPLRPGQVVLLNRQEEFRLNAAADKNLVLLEIRPVRSLEVFGEHPLAVDGDGRLINTLATLFLRDNAIITGKLPHAFLTMNYIQEADRRRINRGRDPFTEREEREIIESAVSLVMKNNAIFIRPETKSLEKAFKADKLLQTIVPKCRIKFLGVWDDDVRQAVKMAGECWRINTLPKTTDEIIGMINDSKIAISDREMYYYNMETGTRLLTFTEFSKLGDLDDVDRARYIEEIKTYSVRVNRHGNPELAFFHAPDFDFSACAETNSTGWSSEPSMPGFEELKEKFRASIDDDIFLEDDPQDMDWREGIYTALIGDLDNAVCEEVHLGLCHEFFMHIQWLAGARIVAGDKIVFDPITETFEKLHRKKLEGALTEKETEKYEQISVYCDEKVTGFIRNLVAEYHPVEYINIGLIIEPLSLNRDSHGRRGVFIAEVKVPGRDSEIIKILRMQKFDVIYRIIEENKTWENAAAESEMYNEYIMDRYRGCVALGMNILPIHPNTVEESFWYPHDGQVKTTASRYYERAYVAGLATDKIHPSRLKLRRFALNFARLLGEAAAANMIVGRGKAGGKTETSSSDDEVLFDDGDEIVRLLGGFPVEIILADFTGAFGLYDRDYLQFVDDYAAPVNRRLGMLKGRKEYTAGEFADIYTKAFVKRFSELQASYWIQRPRFRNVLFADRISDGKGNFKHRWEMLLDKLENAKPNAVGTAIREAINT